MDIDIGISEAGRDAIAGQLEAVLADTYALYGRTHAYHWNVTGPRFHSLHTLFEEQYRELWAALDEIAERIRALGVFAPMSLSVLAAKSTIGADNEVPSAEVMVKNLASGQEALARTAKEALGVAEDHGDPATADLLTIRAQTAEKTAWMLRASL
jgi:starvation-inducible DNA-binding protein